ncbi:MAG: hypothetical protein ABIG35_06295 [Pseudomonadota bacterium]|jgi:predicted nucleic acid-binding protein
MISSSFLTDHQTILVIDASVAINLNATNRAAEIISALPSMVVVTNNAIDELEGGTRNGHLDAKLLQELVGRSLVSPVALTENCLDVYEALVDGNASSTLDDGEAATIAYAIAVGGIAVIDERKARRICGERFPILRLLSTVDLLLDNLILNAIGCNAQAEAIYNALVTARMRVPEDRLSSVMSVIGKDRAVGCISLPKAVRMAN